MYPKKKFDVTLQIVNDKMYLMKQNLCFEINDITVEIWELINGERSLDEIAKKISDIYRISYDQVYRDVEICINDFRTYNLITIT